MRPRLSLDVERVTLTGRIALLRAFGDDPISYSTLQPGMRYLETSFGYVAYRSVRGADITLGPPICAPDDRAVLLRRFMDATKNPILCYVREDVATVAATVDPRLRAGGMGVDWHPDLELLERSPSRAVASAVRKARRGGFAMHELAFDAQTLSRVREITRVYLSRSQVAQEMTFLNRPMGWSADGLARAFSLHTTHGLTGYVVLNPYFSAGAPIGFLLDIVRFEPTPLWGLYLAVVAELARRLRAEGMALSLGFCPLWRIPVAPSAASRLLDGQVRWLARRMDDVQYFRRLRAMKAEFAGRAVPRFFLCRSVMAAVPVMALVRACGLSVRHLVAEAWNRQVSHAS